MKENLVNSIYQKSPELFGVKGKEGRRQTSFDTRLPQPIPAPAPLPIRPFDERGRKPDHYTGRISPIILWVASHIPKAGTLVDIARLADVGYSVVKGAVDGDVLRMPDAAADLTPEQKMQYLKEYMLNRFDRVNRIAKETYHRKKGRRALRRAAGNAAGAGLSLAAEIFVPGYRELGSGIVAPGITASFALDAVVEAALIIREFDEARHIRKRSGKMKKGEYQESPTFAKQLAKAVEIIGISDDPREREAIVRILSSQIDAIRRTKWHAFDRLTAANPRAEREIKRTAKKLERLDYLIDHPTRPLAILSRRIRDRKSLDELKAERQRIRREEVFAYDPRQARYVKAKEIPGYQG